MTTSSKVSVLAVVTVAVVTVAVAAGTVHVSFPGGLPAVIERLAAPAPASKPAPAPPASTPPAEGPALGETELRDAERAYDAGDFARSVELFVAARADAGPVHRERIARGLHKAVLAWALTSNVEPPSPLPDDPDGEVALRQAAADAAPSEQAWFEVTMYAAGCGSARTLPLLAQQAIACAVGGGPVEQRLKSVLARGGPRSNLLRDAMTEMGLLEPVDPVAAAERPKSAGTKPAARTTIRPPGGTFKASTKAKLAQAVELERKGTAEFELSGPDNAQRKQHRKAAVDLLKQARDIYQEAQDEDPDSPDLGSRLRTVMEMISHLHKEMSLGE
jgi:hypothetical protein